MTATDTTIMGHESHRLRGRLALYLGRQYRGEHKTKRLAADIGCTPKTAENILNGHWPSDVHFGGIVQRFGRDVWDAVFAPEVEPVLARLTQEERELEERLELVRRRRRQAGGGRESRSGLLASDQGRSRLA